MKRSVALAVLALLAGCSESEPASGRYWYPLPECPDHDLSACDTLTAACQSRLVSLAACLYGADGEPEVPIQVVTEAELVEQLDALPDDASDDEDEDAALLNAEQTLVQLKLAQAGDLTSEDSTAKLVDRLEGVYIDAEHGIYLVDRGAPRNDADANAVLLHELVHAVQDAEHGLDGWRAELPQTEDAALASRSVVEGQATYLHFRALLAMQGRDVERIDWPLSLEAYEADVLEAAYEDSSPFLASLVTFPYAYGVQLAYGDWIDDGQRSFSRQFAKPPLTTYDVMARVEGNDQRFGATTFTPPEGAEAAGLTARDETALGAFLLELHLRASGATAQNALALRRGWRGDRLFIYADADADAAWLWELTFDTADNAELFADRSFEAGVSAESSGARAFVVGGASAAPTALLEAGRAFLDAE